VDQRDDYRQAISERDLSRGRVADLQTALERQNALAVHPEVTELSATELQRRADQDETVAERAGELRDACVRIEQQVENARAAITMETALATVANAQHALQEKRNEALLHGAGRLLLNKVSEQHQKRSQPAVLKQAGLLFESFTHHAYRLDVRALDGQAEFRAYDTQQERGMALTELSDGTRAQLLLAARLAFVLTSEQDVRPPLFLDESLTASDPQRFHAIATSLLAEAQRTGRQLFYLTANPADALAWQEALRDSGLPAVEPVALADLRKLSVQASPAQITAPPPPSVPAPSDRDAARYGRRLGVPRFDPRRPIGAAHLIHLLSDDLKLLHRLLSARIDTVGQWRQAAAALVTTGLVTAEEAAHLSARADAAAAFAMAWRQGRGRSVDRVVLAASGAVSEKFLPLVSQCAEELAGDGEQIVAALLGGRIKRFKRSKAEELRDYLVREGFIDPEAVLTPEGIREQVYRAVSAHLMSQVLSSSETAGLVDALWQSRSAG
jgi:hypothetical protein